MNEIAQEVFKRADVIGDWASGKLDQTVDAATQQVIDLAMQYVMYGRIYNTVTFILACGFLWFTLWLALSKGFLDKENVVKHGYNNGDWEFSRVCCAAAGVCLSLPSVAAFIYSIKDVILVWAAPKIWLIVQLAELAKVSTK